MTAVFGRPGTKGSFTEHVPFELYLIRQRRLSTVEVRLATDDSKEEQDADRERTWRGAFHIAHPVSKAVTSWLSPSLWPCFADQ